jgi:hypothetical protein
VVGRSYVLAALWGSKKVMLIGKPLVLCGCKLERSEPGVQRTNDQKLFGAREKLDVNRLNMFGNNCTLKRGCRRSSKDRQQLVKGAACARMGRTRIIHTYCKRATCWNVRHRKESGNGTLHLGGASRECVGFRSSEELATLHGSKFKHPIS